MIDTPTVFILGAGASKPYMYPTGRELRKYIFTTMPNVIGDYLYEGDNPHKMNIREKHIRTARKMADIFFNSSTSSIDLFLARNPDYDHIGKLSILTSIFEAEKKSSFCEASAIPEQDWYFYLFHRMTNTLINPEDYAIFGKNNVSFITFNYDRSLEHYLFESFINSFHTTYSKRPPIIDEIMPFEIIHVYGQVAPLEWQVERGGLEYGIDYRLFAEPLADNIRVIYNRADEKQIERAGELIRNTKRIFFLGFGFAEENLKVLGLPGNLNIEHEIYGTAFGMTNKEIGKLKDEIYNGMGGNKPTVYEVIIAAKNKTKLERMHCLELLREYL